MKKIMVSVLALVSALCVFDVEAAPEKPLNVVSPPIEVVSPETNAVKRIATEYMEKYGIPGMAIDVYVDGKPQTYYFGLADKDKKIAVTKNTIFEVGAVTKLMTSLLLAQQVDYATVQLDNSITDYLPQLPAAFDDVGLGNLATHTAGLPYLPPGNMRSKADLTGYYQQFKNELPVEQKWSYSNLGAGLLGDALEKITHKNIEQLYQSRILVPLKMSPFALSVPARYKKFVATGYGKTGAPAVAQPSLFPAATGMKVSAADMQKFLAAAIGLPGTPERILYPMRLTQASMVKLPRSQLSNENQGLGWQIHFLMPDRVPDLIQQTEKTPTQRITPDSWYEYPKVDMDALIDKTGATSGFRAYIAVIPNKQSGIVVMANRYVPNAVIVKMSREILFNLTNMTPEMPNDEV